jgi:hypothetical protein
MTIHMDRRLRTGMIFSLSMCTLLSVLTEGAEPPVDAITSRRPTLDELSGRWMKIESLGSLPSVNNFHGGLKTTADISAIEFLTFPPLSQGGRSGTTYLDEKPILAQESRWHPYQVTRRATQDGLKISSTTRMVFENRGVLIRIEVNNATSQPRSLRLRLDLHGRVRRFDGRWQWNSPRPSDNEFDAMQVENDQILLICDRRSTACTAYAFAPHPDRLQTDDEKGISTWELNVAPGEAIKLDYVMAAGEVENTVVESARSWAMNFDRTFERAKEEWNRRWQDAFTPGNSHFSGNLPTLVTTDEKLRRVYYVSVLSALQLHRTNLPKSSRVFATVGPKWAVSLMYFWDAGMWATKWALLDPVSMKDHLRGWLSLDYHDCYARDYLSGQGAGPWYAANDWSIFVCIDAYLRVTGDVGFLNERINGKTLFEHLEALATNYRQFVRDGDVLADYGATENLLECVPTYIHRVPSFNAANVQMLLRVANLHEKSGNSNHARELRQEAYVLLKKVMTLYVPGQGVWCSLHRDGKKVEMRHAFDFIMVGQSLADILEQGTKKEMLDFVEKELLTKDWMRAQSLSDISAAYSDRPDHGPMGAYDAWPALTMDVMCLFGKFDTALAFLRRTENVTYEGPFAQSHELLGRTFDAASRIANRGGNDYNETCGAAFADVIIGSFFGYRPGLDGEVRLLAPDTARGFRGQLRHLSYHGVLYTVSSDSNGLHIMKE